MRFSKGEAALALFFVALGVVWIGKASTMTPLWDGFAPGSGLMPLVYGLILIGLAGIVLARLVLRNAPLAEEPTGKSLLVLTLVAATIIALPLLGFAPSVFLMMLALFTLVERLPVVRSLLVAAAASAVLYLVFKTWLGVPLP